MPMYEADACAGAYVILDMDAIMRRTWKSVMPSSHCSAKAVWNPMRSLVLLPEPCMMCSVTTSRVGSSTCIARCTSFPHIGVTIREDCDMQTQQFRATGTAHTPSAHIILLPWFSELGSLTPHTSTLASPPPGTPPPPANLTGHSTTCSIEQWDRTGLPMRGVLLGSPGFSDQIQRSRLHMGRGLH